MSTRKAFLRIIGLAFILWLLAGCGSTPTGPTSMPTPIPPSATAAAVPATGTITGRLHLVAPPTPRMVVYAVDQATGLWAFTETTATDGEASFSLVVPEGAYQLFAFSDLDGYAGYSMDGITLAFVSVGANQTVADIVVRPPSQSECGSMFGVPASPEGRFAAVAGPSADCIATIQTQVAGSNNAQTNPETVRIQFNPNATDQRSPGDLEPNMTRSFVLYALKGQQMTVEMTTEPASSETLYASLYIRGADGTVFTPNPTTSWSGVLPASQDYYIEVRSMTQQSILYSLYVAIPPGGSNSNTGGGYGPVSLEVCQTLQELATRAISLTFSMEVSAPFTDPVTGETGQGCTLSAMATGMFFPDPGSVTSNLANSMLGWTEQTAYQASGPTGVSTAMTRDMGLLLIHVQWFPSPEANCPADQPISNCDLKPEQKLYIVQIQAAQK